MNGWMEKSKRSAHFSFSEIYWHLFFFFFLQGCFWLFSTGQTDLPHIISHSISPLDISLFSCRSSSFQSNFLIALLSTPLSPTNSFQIHLTLSLTSSSKWLTKSNWARLLLKFIFTFTDECHIYIFFIFNLHLILALS